MTFESRNSSIFLISPNLSANPIFVVVPSEENSSNVFTLVHPLFDDNVYQSLRHYDHLDHRVTVDEALNFVIS